MTTPAPARQPALSDTALLLDLPAGRWSSLSLLTVALCFLINAVDGMNVFLMSYLAPSVASDWHLSSTTLGEVFSAGLAGMAIGGLLIAPLGDRLGRRPLILASLLTMSTGMILSGYAPSVLALILARVIVGIGIGTVLACMTALVAEFAPPHRRSFAVGLLQGGYPVGATITGFVTAWALASHSWRIILLASGFGSLALFPVTFLLLPESASFLLHTQGPSALRRINRLRARLHATPLTTIPTPPNSTTHQPRKGPLRTILGPQLRHDTLLLWTAIFFGFMVLYSVLSWIPRLAIDAGLNPKSGIYARAVYNIGAFLGTLLLARLADSSGLKRLIAGFLLAAAVLLILFGGIHMPVALVLLTAFAIGVTLQGGFNGIYPLATCVYPVQVRSSGLGWAMGLGRAGSILGPWLAGLILSFHLPQIVLFLALAFPLLITALCAHSVRQPT